MTNQDRIYYGALVKRFEREREGLLNQVTYTEQIIENLKKMLGEDGRNQAAVELGSLGKEKGGHARAAKLSAERRSEIAQEAAKKRWSRSE